MIEQKHIYHISFVVKRKKSGRPWYWTLGIHLWWKKFGLFSIFIWWKGSDIICSVLLPRGFRSLPLWTYQRTNKSKRPQSVGPKRLFCPGCWAAAWTSTTSSPGPTYSRTSSSGTSGRSCTERDCLLSSTNGMKLFFGLHFFENRSKKKFHIIRLRCHIWHFWSDNTKDPFYLSVTKNRKWNVDIWIIVNKYVTFGGHIYFCVVFVEYTSLKMLKNINVNAHKQKARRKTIFVVIYLSILK